MPGLASISIDLDGLSHYAALHGLPPEVVSAEARALVHQGAVPRFAEVGEGGGGRGTLFVTGGEGGVARSRSGGEGSTGRHDRLWRTCSGAGTSSPATATGTTTPCRGRRPRRSSGTSLVPLRCCPRWERPGPTGSALPGTRSRPR